MKLNLPATFKDNGTADIVLENNYKLKIIRCD